MRYVIFDTNIVKEKNDFFFSKADFVKLINIRDIEVFEIYLPEIIIEEIIKKYMDDVSSLIKGLKKFIEKNETYKFFSEDEFNRNSSDISIDIKNRYKNNLKEVMIKKNIKKIDYPREGNTIENILKRFFEKRIPFQDGKESFRDAAIWYSILEFSKKLKDDDIIYFLTNNTKDFYDEENKMLHKDLKKELINEDQIILYKSIDDFINNEKSKIDNEKTIEDNYQYYLSRNDRVIENIEKYIEKIKFMDEKSFIYRSIVEDEEIDSIVDDFVESINPKEDFEYGLGIDLFAELEYFDKEQFEISYFDYEFIGDGEVVVYMTIEYEILYSSVFKSIDYDTLYEENEFIKCKENNKANLEINIEIYLNFEIDKLEKCENIEKYMSIGNIIMERV